MRSDYELLVGNMVPILALIIDVISGDVDDIFLPSPCDLLVNLQACKEQVGLS